MIIYNVTIQIQPGIAGEWLAWMREEHIPGMMDTGLFTDSRLCRLLEQDETDGITFTVQYHCASMEDYQTYIREYAAIMREKSFQRFGDRFIAFRSVMEILP